MDSRAGEWERIDFLTGSALHEYLDTLDEDTKAKELEIYGKHVSHELLKNHMKEFSNFYSFVQDYSPCDFRFIRKKPYISQRVIVQHVQMWNQIHITKIKSLRVFFS